MPIINRPTSKSASEADRFELTPAALLYIARARGASERRRPAKHRA